MGQCHGSIFLGFQCFFDGAKRNAFTWLGRQHIRLNAQCFGQGDEPVAEIALGDDQDRLPCLHSIDQAHFHRKGSGAADGHHMVGLENGFQPGKAFLVNLDERPVGVSISRTGQSLSDRFGHRCRAGNHD